MQRGETIYGSNRDGTSGYKTGMRNEARENCVYIDVNGMLKCV